ALRLIIPNVIAGAVREQLHLSSDHPVQVDLGGSALLYALSGRVGDVGVEIADAELVEGLRGSVQLHADAVPFDFANGEIQEATARLTLDREQLPEAISLLTGGIADSGAVRDGDLVIGRSVEIFGVGVEVSVTLGLAVNPDGTVAI